MPRLIVNNITTDDLTMGILLHLDANRVPKDQEPPYAVTKQGIAKLTGVDKQKIALRLKYLRALDLITEFRSRVCRVPEEAAYSQRSRQPKFCYALTEAGRAFLARLATEDRVVPNEKVLA